MIIPDQPRIGRSLGRNLTVPQAAEGRDFYSRVVGWDHSYLDIGDYADYKFEATVSGHRVCGRELGDRPALREALAK